MNELTYSFKTHSAQTPRAPQTPRSAGNRGRSPGPLAGDTLPTDDPERMGALLAELEPRMNAVALRYTRDPEVAGDVVQNACEKVLRHGSKFRGQSLVSTWIHRIVANEALMWLRSEGRRRTLHEDEPDAAVKSRAFRARRHLEEAVKHSAFI